LGRGKHFKSEYELSHPLQLVNFYGLKGVRLLKPIITVEEKQGFKVMIGGTAGPVQKWNECAIVITCEIPPEGLDDDHKFMHAVIFDLRPKLKNMKRMPVLIRFIGMTKIWMYHTLLDVVKPHATFMALYHPGMEVYLVIQSDCPEISMHNYIILMTEDDQ
jgi:hypothetical protein